MTTTTKTRSSKPKFKADPETAAAKRTEAMQLLETGITELLNSDRWTDYLKFHSNFHSYSWNNTLLIWMQRPDATKVAGFNDWKKRGRHVKKGEKGISILAPAPYKKTETGANGEEVQVSKMYFKTVAVFDIEQTEGDPVPEIIHPLTGDDCGLFDKLVTYASSLGVRVKVQSLDFNGYCHFEDKKPVEIVIADHLESLHRTKTLTHEIAHALVHGEVDYSAHRPQCELEAESTAFVVLNHFGLDTSSYSVGYISNWNNKDAIVQLRASCDRIHKASGAIIDGIGS